MTLVLFLSAAVFLTAGFAFLGMMWISVTLRRLLRDGRALRSPMQPPDLTEPAE